MSATTRNFLTIVFSVSAAVSFAASGNERTTVTVNTERAAEIAAMLPEKPQGIGYTIAERDVWEKRGRDAAFAGTIGIAERYLAEPIAEIPDELYLEFSRNGNRTNWQNRELNRRRRLTPLVIAECLENKGRFLPAIEDIITTLCAERTWVLPAHDASLTNFHGTNITVDLASSALAWSLAIADDLLGEKLNPSVRARLRERVSHFVLQPYSDMIHGKRKADWWLTGTNNWNSVCLAGVTGAGLTLLDSRSERGELVAAAEELSEYFLSGFTPDGYCSEGLGYWNYGFGHYVLLSETVRHATGGKIDMLTSPSARMPAQFGARIQIINDVAPAFADCAVSAKPMENLMWLLNRRFDMGLQQYSKLNESTTLNTLQETMVYLFAVQGDRPKVIAVEHADESLRTWFDVAGVLICRPKPDSPGRFAVAMKGGHNAEHHNHNDLGSYVVVVGAKSLLLDPGAEVYTKRTFSSKRYDGKLLNSYGHPVPVIAGKLQRPGGKAKAKVLTSQFEPEKDTLALDLKLGYDVPDLKKLERTFTYNRGGAGSLSITDHVEFRSPQTFESALITASEFSKDGEKRIVIKDGDESLAVDIDTGGVPFTISTEKIEEDAAVKPTRIAIKLVGPVQTATVSLSVKPL